MDNELNEVLEAMSECASTPLTTADLEDRPTYVCGFMFCGEHVALIEKKRPAWQAGKLNGVGGKVEAGETMYAAMCREFFEETGIPTNPSDWRLFALTGHCGAAIGFFTTRVKSAHIVPNLTDEWVTWRSAHAVSTMNIIDNLRWLIPLALSESKEVVCVADPSVPKEAA